MAAAGSADLPQQQRFGQIGDGERVDAALHEGAPDLRQAVAVGVGFHYRHQFHGWPDAAADRGDVVPKRVEINLHPAAVIRLRNHIIRSSVPKLRQRWRLCFYFESVFVPEKPSGMVESHRCVFGGGVDHTSGAGLAADGDVLPAVVVFPQADDGAAFVCVHNDDCFEPEPTGSPFAGAFSLLVSTTPSTGNCGTLCAGGAGACGVMAVGTGDGVATLSGDGTFNVGETGGRATLVGGSTSFGAVCE